MRKYFWIPVVVASALYAALPLPGSSAPLQKRIEEKRGQVERKRRVEGVLTTTISRYTTRIRGLSGRIGATQRRLGTVQRSLDAKRAQLLRVRNRLDGARDELARARSQLRNSRRGLAARLVELYKSDPPDLLTVVLEADGFNDLLERTDFMERIARRDRRIVARVRRLKVRAEEAERALAVLESAKRRAAVAVLRRRDDIAATRDQLASTQADLRGERRTRRTLRDRVRRQRWAAQEDLASLEREQAKVRNALAAAGPRAFSPAAGPVRKGTGRFIWPVNGPITSPFGPRWGRLHAGIDISAPGGTPIRAADSGRVVLAAFTGGYGNYTCVQHTRSLSTCYAHQSRLGTSSGAAVRQGQVIGYVGNTGNSFGNHLHFEVRVGGTPVNPLGYL